jgi:hypothetical protein
VSQDERSLGVRGLLLLVDMRRGGGEQGGHGEVFARPSNGGCSGRRTACRMVDEEEFADERNGFSSL